ncbi:toxin-antitoxin system YwqK family antitoxin [Pseudoalteromonas sp.]|uniref:toxin-antitoxin system YwqK family antitoxin n=1 Tax=Pseudoalteromonas sp. TaxID=53249 RepID=UPI003F98FC40
MTFKKCFFKVFLLLISILNTPSAYTKTAQNKPISPVVSTSDTTNKVQWLDKDLQPTANKNKATYLLAEAKKVDNGYRLVITHLDNQPYYQTNVDTLNLEKATAIGPYKTYFRSGELKVEGQRNNNGLNTGIKTYYAKDGHKIREKTYKNGELNGAYKSYNGQGKLLMDRTMSDGKQDGVERGYFNNGQLRSESEYKNDEKHGLAKRWDSKGNLLRKSYFVNGSRHGVSTQYFKDGSVEKIQKYKNGRRIGKTTLYYEDGSLRREDIRNDKGRVIAYRAYSRAGLLTRSQEQVETDKGLIEERKSRQDHYKLNL